MQDCSVVDKTAIEFVLESVSPLLKINKIFLDDVYVVVGKNDLEVVERQVTVATEWGICFLELFCQCSHKSISTLPHFVS